MRKEKFNFEHPAYEKTEDLKIDTPQELKEAKKIAGVTTHEEAMKRFEISEREIKSEGKTEDNKYHLVTIKSIEDFKIKGYENYVVIKFEETAGGEFNPGFGYRINKDALKKLGLGDLKVGDKINVKDTGGFLWKAYEGKSAYDKDKEEALYDLFSEEGSDIKKA